MECQSQQFDQLLHGWRSGHSNAKSGVFKLVYGELYKIATCCMRGQGPGHTLQATALVNEAYLRLTAQELTPWRSRKHFFVAASHAMRCILVDHARRRLSQKRGSDGVHLSFNDAVGSPIARPDELVALDEALEKLAKLEPKLSRVVLLHYFGGLNWDEIACVLGVSSSSVNRSWAVARAWLRRQLAAQA